MEYKKLFSKGKIGNLELKNRIVMPAIGTALASYNGEASPEIIAYYEERAKGGCGLIITEIVRIDEEYGVGTANQLTATSIKHIAQLERLARTVHKYDTKIFVQLHHPGRESHSHLIGGKQLIAPSAIPCGVCKEVPRAITTEEVENLVKSFVKGAAIAQKAGIDGVELHGAHGYLIDQFLSPYTNKRTDKYGGSFEGRLTFITEIIMGIKHVCGPKFPISVRIDGDEFVEGGLTLEDSVKIAVYLEKLGVAAINVSCGIYESGYSIIEPIAFEQGWKKHLAKTIKENISIPVIAVNNIKHPSVAEELLNEGVMDFAGLGRAQLADAEFALKAQEGRADEITPCISCLHCIDEVESGKTLKCAVNPKVGRELDLNNLKKDGDNRTIVVIGGGPAGMEAAKTSALRGFKVVLFEKESVLGGMVALGNKPPQKDKLTSLIDFYERELAKLGVEIRLNSTADLNSIKALNPYAVFVATGSNPIIPAVEGATNSNVYNVSDVLSGKINIQDERVMVIGSGMTGCETAEYLAVRDNKIVLVDMLPKIGTGVYPSNMYTVVGNLKKHNVDIRTSHKLIKINENSVELVNLNNSETVVIDVDKVVLSLGIKPNNSLVQALEDNFDKVRVIGDANAPGRIAEAVRQGFEKVYVL